ncbi:hypothetical protein [Streptomyces odontomachi]|uniref:hypothetical protein n=1 Tax=Streptomyces odontomachi TaxID=2944940 RepID=UPI00210ECD39|nr:hypothetical protein [Streptomyces sp. ODS25]
MEQVRITAADESLKLRQRMRWLASDEEVTGSAGSRSIAPNARFDSIRENHPIARSEIQYPRDGDILILVALVFGGATAVFAAATVRHR